MSGALGDVRTVDGDPGGDAVLLGWSGPDGPTTAVAGLNRRAPVGRLKHLVGAAR